MANDNSLSHIAALAAFKGQSSKAKEDAKKNEVKTAAATATAAASSGEDAKTRSSPQRNGAGRGGGGGGGRGVASHKMLPKIQTRLVNSARDENLMSAPVTPIAFSRPVTPNSGQIYSGGGVRVPGLGNSAFYDSSDGEIYGGGEYFTGVYNYGQPRRVQTTTTPTATPTAITQQQQQQLLLLLQPLDVIREMKKSIESKLNFSDLASNHASTLTRNLLGIPSTSVVELVKSSVNSKLKNEAKRKERMEKNRRVLQSVRDSIELKKIVSHSGGSGSSLHIVDDSKLLYSDSFNGSEGNLEEPVYDKPFANISNSSFGSSILDVDRTSMNTPRVVVDDENCRATEASGGYSNADDDEYEDCALYNLEPNGSGIKPIHSPVDIPLSLHACARLGLDANDSTIKALSSSSLPEAKLNLKLKPKRKPPPQFDVSSGFADHSDSFHTENDSECDFSDTSSTRLKRTSPHTNALSSSSKEGVRARASVSTFFYDEGHNNEFETFKMKKSATDGFPRYPDLGAKSKLERTSLDAKHHGLKHKKDTSFEALESPYFQGQSESESEAASGYEADRPRLSSEIATRRESRLQQPIQLKATMRKTNKRKEKKLLFNENKPWKNHSELSYVTEQERKRYEGIWTSNKGLYMNAVVTRLNGVKYDDKGNEQATVIEGAPAKAARLSSQNNASNNNSNYRVNFHNLEEADIDQLIHGVVVKRIWQRSRLPNETLETIWNLVDFRKDGTLNKPEFLVGMWLVDQCLYGRKLPKKVGDEVWVSLGSIGLNVVIKKKGKK